MKILSFIIIVILTSGSLFASSVEWNCFEKSNFFDGYCNFYYYADNHQPGHYYAPEISLSTEVNGSKIILTGHSGYANIEFAGLWVKMNPGDYITYDTMVRDTGYLMGKEDKYVINGIDSYPIEINRGESIYLAVMEDVTNPIYNDATGYYYGWIEIKSNSKGELSLQSSAFATDGSGMIVGGGAIPEPTSAMLFFLGIISIALRRGSSP